MSKIFGGSKSKSQQTASSTNESGNLAYPQISQDYGVAGATTFRNGALALNDELSGGFEGYKKNVGFDFFKMLGLDKVGAGQSGRGVFNSGATLKALADYEQNIGQAAYGDYLGQLSQSAGLGLQAGNLVANAGQYSKGQSQSQGTSSSSQNNGMGKFIGQIIGAAAAGSDVRLKMNITKVGEQAGLGVYEYHYINGAGPYLGYMAQEVERLYPEAMGPERAGYLTVDYGKLADTIGEFSF